MTNWSLELLRRATARRRPRIYGGSALPRGREQEEGTIRCSSSPWLQGTGRRGRGGSDGGESSGAVVGRRRRRRGCRRRFRPSGLDSSEEKEERRMAEPVEHSAGLGDGCNGVGVRWPAVARVWPPERKAERERERTGGKEAGRDRWGRLLGPIRARGSLVATAHGERTACFTMVVTGRRF